MNGLFPASGLGPLYTLSQLGLVLFMFLVGLKFRPYYLRGSAKSIIIASQTSVVAPFLLGGLLAWELYPRLGEGVPRLPFVLFLGASLGITAVAVLARILADRKLTQTRVGRLAISCAAVDDLTAWCLLAVITVIARPQSAQILLGWRFAALVGYLAAIVLWFAPWRAAFCHRAQRQAWAVLAR